MFLYHSAFPFPAVLPDRRKTKKYPNLFSQRIRFGYERYGGELGTRTSAPLRVMHDDFSIFSAIIRQIDEICYRSATNGIFESLLIILLLSFLTTPCTTKQLSSIGSKM